MQLSNFESAIQSHFRFLIDEFGFSIIEARYEQEMGNAIVIFAMNKTRIEVVRDRGNVLISLGDESLNRWDWVEFAKAIEFLAGNKEPVYLTSSLNNVVSDDVQVSHLATLMRAYCMQLLSGEMSVIKLRDAIRAHRTQETRTYLDKLQDSWTEENND